MSQALDSVKLSARPASTLYSSIAATPRVNPINILTRQGENRTRQLDAMSPVTPAGTYEGDRILRSGRVLKRRKRTHAWNPVYLVLRPGSLSLYKDRDETHLRHQIHLSDISTIALRTDRKRKGDHDGVFALFSPARNYHFEADNLEEATAWVKMIRREARLDEEEAVLLVSSPNETRRAISNVSLSGSHDLLEGYGRHRELSSSPEPPSRFRPRSAIRTTPIAIRGPPVAPSHAAVDTGSYSDFSDTPFGSALDTSPIARGIPEDTIGALPTSDARSSFYRLSSRTMPAGHTIQATPANSHADEERVIRQGYLLCLRSRGGVRQWKKYWTVLRSKTLALYKNTEEYSALLILPTSALIDAVDLDPMSKNRQYCMQVISEDRSYRFSTESEDDLSQWVGSVKSVLAKQREAASKLSAR